MRRKVEPIPDFPSMERRILDLWRDTRAFERLREKNSTKPKWSFLDGPITANNPMGVHHAWGRSLKDMFQRYHAMTGKQLRYQNGFDCQGLWVEVEVEKELGFKSKDDILAYGIDRFVEKCKERVRKYAAVQTEQSVRLGYWMDWDDSYFTMSDDNNFMIWAFLKRCHERGFVYKGSDVMPWCPRCGVGLSQMEMHEGYRVVRDASVIVRFPLRGREKEALLVWTTTPWTLTSNVAAAVNPDMEYYLVRHGGWTYYVGRQNWERNRTVDAEGKPTNLKSLPALVAQSGAVEVAGSVAGRELLGLMYDGPFDEFPAQSAPGGHPFADPALSDRDGVACHRVIPWAAVTGGEGTGVVHIAPGCGKEDYELGKEFGLVNIAPLDERGCYVEGFGSLSGSSAQEAAEKIVADLDSRGFLVAREEYPHSYPHCWRCQTPVLFRLVDEWFIKMDWRDEIVKTVDEVRWIPDFGRERELDWLRNMRDWMISKKRYWGLALPIWVCGDCSHFDVIGSRKELQDRAIEGWERFDGHSPHRPWLDEVVIGCPKCGGKAGRVPDVGNPWLDAGIVPFSTVGYLYDKDYWRKWFPADLVLECFPGQFRNWFYALLAMSAMLEGRAPFRALLGHALVRDEAGREMHKSLGNAIEFNEAAETVGAEVMRYIFAAQNPVNNLNFPDIRRRSDSKKVHLDREVKRKLLTFWNCYSFFVQYAELDKWDRGKHWVPPSGRSELDFWILSRLQKLISAAHEAFTEYELHSFMGKFEGFVEEDLSNWWLRRSRRRFWSASLDEDKKAAYSTLYDVLLTVTGLIAPVLPFLSEEIYQNMVRANDESAPISVHLLDYPVADPSLANDALEAGIGAILRYKSLGLALRRRENLKVRQPLARLVIRAENDAEVAALRRQDLRAVLLDELNVKALDVVDDETPFVTVNAKVNFGVLGPRIGDRVKAVAKAVAQADAAALRAGLASGQQEIRAGDFSVTLIPGDVEFEIEGAKGYSAAYEGGAFAALNTQITPDLAAEGAARDFVRQVQNLRKEHGFEIDDRIHLRFSADPSVSGALTAWGEFIQSETLALTFEADASPPGAGFEEIRVSGKPVRVSVRREVKKG